MKKATASIGILLSCFVLVLFATSFTDLELRTLVGLGHNTRFARALVFSLLTSCGATLCAFVLGVPTAFWLSRSRHGLARLGGIVLEVPLVVPPLLIGVLLLKVSGHPLAQQLFNLVFTFQGALLAQFIVAVPLMIKSAESAFRLVPCRYEQLATTMGSSPLRAFLDTTWPLAWPGIMSGILMTWMRTLGEFGATLMVGGGIPGKTENIPIFIYLSISEGDFAAGMGACALLILTVLVLLLLLRWRTAGRIVAQEQLDD